VQSGSARDGRIEVREGLSAGERVVIGGIERVVHERPVLVVDRLADGNDG
jgi:multidrug efflux pump subunit AcrA (membrane-fusion protein)